MTPKRLKFGKRLESGKCLGFGLLAALALALPAQAAPLPRYGAFVFSSLCTQEESTDAAGYRLILVRLPYENDVTFEWSEGPLVGAAADHVTIDDKTGRLRFHVAKDGDPGTEQTVSGILTADAFVKDGNGPLTRLARVTDFSRDAPYCTPGLVP